MIYYYPKETATCITPDFSHSLGNEERKRKRDAKYELV